MNYQISNDYETIFKQYFNETMTIYLLKKQKLQLIIEFAEPLLLRIIFDKRISCTEYDNHFSKKQHIVDNVNYYIGNIYTRFKELSIDNKPRSITMILATHKLKTTIF